MKKIFLIGFILIVTFFQPRVVRAEQLLNISGRLTDLNNTPVAANITLYQAGTSNVNATNQTGSDGSYSLNVLPNLYDIRYDINNFSISNFWIKIISLNITSNLNDLVNYVTWYPVDNKLLFTLNVTGNKSIQTYSDKKPNNVSINGTVLTEVSSLSELKNNTWFYDSAGKKLYLLQFIITSSMPSTTTLPPTTTVLPTTTTTSTTASTTTTTPTTSKKIVFRTSHWLAASSPYGYDNMASFMTQLHASDMMIYFKDSDIAGWQWTRLSATVDFFISKGFTIWLIIGKTTYDENASTPYSVQYVIDTFKGRVKGIMFDLFMSTNPTEATNWLLAKKQQLEPNGMEEIYYHGDDASLDYGNPSTDVNATYLNSQGLTVFAWLQNDNSWKPKTFNLQRFWIDYDILNSTSSGGPTGRSYAEIWNWYQNNVINADKLKANAGCKALTFMVYTSDSWPASDTINAMIDVANDWLK